jgi:hypothetical protein
MADKLDGRRKKKRPSRRKPETTREDVESQTAILLRPESQAGRRAMKVARKKRRKRKG